MYIFFAKLRLMNTSIIALLMSVFYLTGAFAFEFRDYNLTDIQIKTLKLLLDKGFSSQKLQAMAEDFERINERTYYKEYIPPHTKQDLEDLRQWAIGDVFFHYSKQAGVTFDKETFRKDCPNWPLFGFLRASGTKFINYDIMLGHMNMHFILNLEITRNPDNFRAIYLELAQKHGFLSYIK